MAAGPGSACRTRWYEMRCRVLGGPWTPVPAPDDLTMPRLARIALLVAIAAVPVATAGAEQRPGPPPPPPTPPAVVTTNHCALATRWHLRCPDLEMKRPFGLQLQYSHGQALLRAGNSTDTVGGGPAELGGRRVSRRFMRGSQRIYRSGRGHITARTGA